MSSAPPIDLAGGNLPGYSVKALIFDGDPTRIYRAKRLSDNLPVLLKSIGQEQTVREASACLKHEFEIAKRLQVPSVIKIYSLENINNIPIVVLEDFGGDSLDNLAKQRRFSLQEILQIAIKLAQGIGEIHHANIIHKDINPSNIVYNPETGVLKIIDFGISSYLTREQAAIANANVLEASLPYVSPEQTGRMNRSIDYRTDFYSMGATLYELLTGSPLFEVSEAIEWFHSHIAKQPKPPAEIDPLIPLPVSNIIMKLLAKMAEDRYQSALGIQNDLQRSLDELSDTGKIELFELGWQDIPNRFQIPQRLYGRKKEVGKLLSVFDQVTQGENHLVLVSGYSGIGKTCAIKEIYKPVTERRAHFISGKFDQLHRNVPYSAIVSALRDLMRQLLTENEDQLGLWRQKILTALGSNAQLMVELIRELELIIGPQTRVPDLPPLEAEQRFYLVFHSFIQVFAAAEYPLVIFLDDLQWADNASLRVLELLTNPDLNNRYLLVIGAYRDNEVQAGHPFLLTLKSIRERGAPISEIQLQPLNRSNLVELLSDTLVSDAETVLELAELVEQKTAGNPFFTEEFLKVLHKEGLITFSQAERRWTWQLDKIQAQQMTDNLVELMTAKLKELPKQTLDLLELAACIGNRFQLRSLVVVSQLPATNISKHLFTAMLEGVIAPIGGAYQLLELDALKTEDLTVEFAFAHDRIQQAAYAILDANRRKEAHLNIGRLLLPELLEQRHKEILFEVTNHLNLGSELITSEDEIAQLCKLNIQAGLRAKNSTAYHAALDYLSKAYSFTDDQWWDSNYEMKLAIHTDAAEAAYLSHQFDMLNTYIEPGLKQARNLLDKVDLYIIQASAMVAQGKLREAVEMAKPVMAQLGHRYPAYSTKKHVIIELIKLRWALRKTSISQILNLPEMSDAQHIAANALGARIARAALFVEPNLLPLMVLYSARVQLKFGLTPEAVTTWGVYGMIQASELGKADKGFEYGQLAMKLVERYEDSTLKGRAIHVFNAMVRHWKEPIANSVEPLWDAYRLSLESGDFEYSALAVSVLAVFQFDTGLNLNQWRENLEEIRAILKSLNQGNQSHYIEALQQFCENLTGNSEDPLVLKGEFYDIDTRYAEHKLANDASLLVVDEDYSIMLSYIFGAYKTALEQRNNAEVSRLKSGGFYRPVRSFMLDSLVRIANISTEQDEKINRKLMRAVQRNQKALKRLSLSCPDNYLNKFELVAAELLRLNGDDFSAHQLFDKSAQLAADQGFIHEQALAVELCGSMHAKAGRDTIATPYLLMACDLYTRWGAKAKVDNLHHCYPELLSHANNKVKKSTSGTTTAHMASFDITSLMKALKAIAEEKIHSRMVEVIVASAVEFAGAQHGLLILRDAEGNYFIEGEADVEGGTPRILQSLPVTAENIPQALFHYVTRTLTSVVIQDAQQPVDELPGLELDRYIQSNKVRSVLCLPIVSGGGEDKELNGVIYLENNLASGTFTQERFDTLEIIGMAAAGRLELSRKAAFDGLTGLFNHEYFQNMLSQEIAIAKRHERDLALILIDIDHFKKFNDSWGHQLGDQVLREVAQLIKTSCRTSDIVARYGGEEMVVILPSTEKSPASDVAERIRTSIENHLVSHEEHMLSVTISLGLSMLRKPNESKTALIERADRALYRSKENGRNRLTVDD